jgi:Coenzyme PQQ synthesis protein D (PqqD)
VPPDEPAKLTFEPDEPLGLDAERAVWRQVGDEVVILDVPTATYLTLNSSAVTLWDLLAETATPVELAAKLVATYDISADKAAKDVEHFLGALQERSLILPAK